jgi:hypothetical protein
VVTPAQDATLSFPSLTAGMLVRINVSDDMLSLASYNGQAVTVESEGLSASGLMSKMGSAFAARYHLTFVTDVYKIDIPSTKFQTHSV